MSQSWPPMTVEECCTWFAETLEHVLDETLHVCSIPAPTFDEAERATYVAQRMQDIGLSDVHRDALHNVTGIAGQAGAGPTTLVVAHIDTVFPRRTPLNMRRTPRRLYGPSIGDNSVAVAAMLKVATAIHQWQPQLPGRVIFAASVGEEGLGNLCGIRQLLETWHGQIDTVIAVEGHGVDEVRYAGIGSTRLQVVFEGPGGHSWAAFGTPSAIHAMGTAIHYLARLPVASDPKTTYNVGVVEGGDSVNTIAPQASMLVDLRSVHPAHLVQLATQVDGVLQQVAAETGIKVTSRIVGQRPAAALDLNHVLCQGIRDIRQYLRLRPAIFSASSTDANWPLSLGIPSVCLGITRGDLAHTVEEYIDTAPILSGIQQLFLTILQTLSPDTGFHSQPILP